MSVKYRFNRGGDSLGVHAADDLMKEFVRDVSIAGAILWGFMPTPQQTNPREYFVSIAGAILWGFMRLRFFLQLGKLACFNRGGDSLGVHATQ